jgi:hypothetical protein
MNTSYTDGETVIGNVNSHRMPACLTDIDILALWFGSVVQVNDALMRCLNALGHGFLCGVNSPPALRTSPTGVQSSFTGTLCLQAAWHVIQPATATSPNAALAATDKVDGVAARSPDARGDLVEEYIGVGATAEGASSNGISNWGGGGSGWWEQLLDGGKPVLRTAYQHMHSCKCDVAAVLQLQQPQQKG